MIVSDGNHHGLPVENFEAGQVGGNANFAQPLDSTTNNGYFVPGDILDGLQITTVSTSTPSSSLWGVDGGIFHNTTLCVGTSSSLDDLQILFLNNDAFAVGMDLLLEYSGGTATIIVYGSGNTPLGVTQQSQGNPPTDTFFGVTADQPITRIDVISPTLEFVDNIRFGSGGRFPWPLFLPAIIGNAGTVVP